MSERCRRHALTYCEECHMGPSPLEQRVSARELVAQAQATVDAETIRRLRKQLLDARAALSEATADSQRLDWIEKRRAVIRCEDPQLGYREPWSVTDYAGGTMKWVRGDGSSLREAIDGAIAAAQAAPDR